MRFFIIFVLITALSVVLGREFYPHHRDNAPLRRYKDTKNKRGIGDYPFGLPFGGPSFSAFQLQPPPPPAGAPLAPGGFAGFGGFGGGSPLGLSPSPFGLSSAFGSSGLGSLGSYSSISQPLSLGQGSGYSLSGSGVNLANLLGGQRSAASSYSSPSIGLFSPSESKTGPVTFGAQGVTAAQAHQYTPVYATATQLGSNSYSSPSALSSSQGPSIQAYSQQSPISLSSLFGGNAVTYSSPSSSPTSSASDLASHAVTNNYVIAAAPHTGGSTQSYTVPLSAVASSSSPTYSVAFPPSYTTTSANSASSSPTSTYQLAIAPSTYSASPLSQSASNQFTKYIPISSDASMYVSKGPKNTYNSAIKLSSYVSPSIMYESSPKATSQQTTATSTNHASPSQSVTSYGTPVVMFSIPSTSYGTPSQQSSSSSTQYTSSGSGNESPAHPSLGYAAASSYSSPSYVSSSSSHQSDSLTKSLVNNIGSPATSYLSPNSNYGSSTGSSAAESSSVSGYKIQSPSQSTSTLSNSIENYSSAGLSNTHDSGADSSSSYSSHAPRYTRYHPIRRPSVYLDNDEDESMGSSYDTISYSVPSEKY